MSKLNFSDFNYGEYPIHKSGIKVINLNDCPVELQRILKDGFFNMLKPQLDHNKLVIVKSNMYFTLDPNFDPEKQEEAIQFHADVTNSDGSGFHIVANMIPEDSPIIDDINNLGDDFIIGLEECSSKIIELIRNGSRII